jgi:hypothetical protein
MSKNVRCAPAWTANANGGFLPIKVAEAKPQDIAGAKTDAGEQQ